MGHDCDEVEQVPPLLGADIVFGQDVVGESDADCHEVDLVEWAHVHVKRDG